MIQLFRLIIKIFRTHNIILINNKKVRKLIKIKIVFRKHKKFKKSNVLKKLKHNVQFLTKINKKVYLRSNKLQIN